MIRMLRISRLAPALLSLLLLMPLAGCWSRHELNDISIVVGMGIDKKNGLYQVSAQIVNPGQVAQKKSGGGSFSPVVTYQASGLTIPDALARMTVKVSRVMYLSHLRILILGEEIARGGISKPLDFISRNRELRTDFYLIVAKNASASEILDMYSPIDPIPSNSLFTKLETSDNTWSATSKVTVDRLIQNLSKEGKGPALTTIELVGKPAEGEKISSGQDINPAVLLKYDGMAAFKYDRMAGWMDENDARVLNFIQNSMYMTTLTAPCPSSKGLVSYQVLRSHANIRSLSPDEFEVVLHTQQDISDIGCRLDITDPSTLSALTKAVDEQIEAMMNKTIHKLQKQLKVDVFGFGDALHRQNPKEWHKIKDWDREFETVRVKVTSVSTIRRIGTTIKSMEDEIQK
ncbi:Ger(x)C family spore germination protein [Paenibacillus sp. D51F]